MNTLFQDIRFGLRVLAKNPGFTAIAVLTLALGIGANTALFSVVNSVLINPLPLPHPDELVVAYTKTATADQNSVSYLNFLDWAKNNQSFSSLAAFRSDDFNMTGSGVPERVHAHMISANFFSTLGIQPLLGRFFHEEEDKAGASPVVILSEGLWHRKFASSADVLGKNITLNGKMYTILGVGPTNVPELSPTDVFVLIGQWTDPSFLDRRISMGTNTFARLKPGVSIQQASSDLDRVAANLEAAYPEADKGSGVNLIPLKTDAVGNVRGILLVLLGAVSFVLLIACANVANLLLARSTGRAREFAIRAALGASPARVIRQLLTESVLLSLAGGCIGLIFAKLGVRVLVSTMTDTLPRVDEISLDTHVLFYTLGISLATGILFGLIPALKTLRPDTHETLKEGGRGASGARHRTQNAFIVLEMAMAVVLLIGAGLMIRTLTALGNINPGFDPHNVLTFSVSTTSGVNSTAGQLRAKYRETLRQMESIPGVESASVVGGSIPMTGDSEIPFWLEGQPKPANDNDMPFALFYIVTPGYQQAMRIPVERGRSLTGRDDEHGPSVVLIDSNFARKFFPNQDPVGKHLNLALFDTKAEIVGVVAHVEHWGLGAKGHQDLQTEIYIPVWQVPDRFWPLLANGSGYVARTAVGASDITNSFRQAVAKADSSAVIYDIRPMEDIVAHSISTQRLTMFLLSIFSAIALILSAVGIYGVISYLTSRRTHEIGVRVALGASKNDVLKMVLGQGLKITLLGVAIGLAAALGLTRLITTMIYGVGATDPITFAGVAILLSGIALLACYVPAHRAMRVDPLVALRYE
jgi:predicted permease